jgi:ADP-heptose:LPS heptosyltransferase
MPSFRLGFFFSYYQYEVKVLVVRFSSIGDIVLTESVVRCIKEQIPTVEIHYLTKESFLDLVKYNPNVSKVHVLMGDWTSLIKSLLQEKFDYIIDLHNNLRTRRLKWALQTKSFSFPKRNIEKYIYTRFKRNVLPKNEHVVDRYFSAVSHLAVRNDYQPNRFYINTKNEIDLKSIGLIKKEYLAVAIGAQFNTKKLPVEKIMSVLKNCTKPIVLLGNQQDELEAQQLIKSLGIKEIQSFCGKLNLLQSASLIKQSAVLLTHDTGLMHIAACFETPIVSVWGNTTPALGMSAYTPTRKNQAVQIEVNNLGCRPCSKIGYQVCPKGHFSCMNLQDEHVIWNEIKKRIQN